MAINGDTWKKGTIIGVPLTAVAGLVLASYVNLTNQTAVAIKVAQQHGDELNTIRSEITRLEGIVQGQLGDRFRGKDWLAAREWIEAEFRLRDEQIARCCK